MFPRLTIEISVLRVVYTLRHQTSEKVCDYDLYRPVILRSIFSPVNPSNVILAAVGSFGVIKLKI